MHCIVSRNNLLNTSGSEKIFIVEGGGGEVNLNI